MRFGRGQFWSIVNVNPIRISMKQAELVDKGCYSFPWYGGMDQDPWTYPEKMVDNRRYSESASIGKGIIEKTRRPNLIGPLGRCHLNPDEGGTFSS